MKSPTVSFVVPCYKLAHFLPECINSILSQSFREIEVLVMDDCSPDNTGEVTRSFNDARIRYIRNDSNLGHLPNYNKGINLSRGAYIWLISADDRLRRPYAVERYVKVMADHPAVGYVFCPGIGLVGGAETTLLEDYYYGAKDIIFDGRQFIATVLRKCGGLLSPSVMVRKDCYERISMFPLDLPHQGDMYLWLVWALEYDVAYLSDPMVNYRSHELNMMKDFMSRVPKTVFTDEVNVLWRTKLKSEQKGLAALNRQIEYHIANKYSAAAAFSIYGVGGVPWGMSIAECDGALRTNSTTISEYRRLRSNFHGCLADRHWLHGDFGDARRCYTLAIRDDWRMPGIWAKLVLASMGRVGRSARGAIRRWKFGRSMATPFDANSCQ
jgi:glycosyltransferase involved in cell wall biosynthesis